MLSLNIAAHAQSITAIKTQAQLEKAGGVINITDGFSAIDMSGQTIDYQSKVDITMNTTRNGAGVIAIDTRNSNSTLKLGETHIKITSSGNITSSTKGHIGELMMVIKWYWVITHQLILTSQA